MLRIIVQSIRQPGAGKKRYLITTTDGAKLGAWPNQIPFIKEGVTYDVETEDYQGDNGFVMTNLTKITKVEGMPPPAASAVPREPFVSGAYRQPANSPLAPPPPSPMSKDEQIFVQGIVQSLVRSGDVTLDTVEAAVNKMRGVWKRTLGRAIIQQHIDGIAAE